MCQSTECPNWCFYMGTTVIIACGPRTTDCCPCLLKATGKVGYKLKVTALQGMTIRTQKRMSSLMGVIKYRAASTAACLTTRRLVSRLTADSVL